MSSTRVVSLLLLAAAACDQRAAELERPSAAGTARPRTPELRFAVGAMLSPIATYESYEALFRGLSSELGRPYQFVQRRTYQELNEILVNGEVEVAFICSGAYVSLPDDADVEILAVPETDGKTAYRGLIVVHRDSPYQKLADLEGTRFAFTDPMSNTGYFYPVSRVKQLGENINTFFRSTIFSGSHDRSLLAVERRMVDGAAVFDIGIKQRGPKIGNGGPLRIIEESPAFSPPPVVAPLSVPEETRRTIQKYLLGLSSSASGRDKLKKLGITRFRSPAGIGYESVRAIMETATGTTR